MATPTKPRRADPSGRAWLVPLSIGAALTLGFLGATLTLGANDPSGIVQGPFTTPLAQQWDSYDVVLVFGAPWAALVAAVASYAGLTWRRAWVGPVLGAAVGVATMAFVGWQVVPIGRWWLAAAPRDPVLAGVFLALYVTPPTTFALLLGTVPGRTPSAGRRSAPLLRLIWSGVLLGLFVGAFAASQGAAIAWGTAPADSWYLQHESLTGELLGAMLLGAFEGLVIGAVCGIVAWGIRYREAPGPPAAEPTSRPAN